MAGTKPGKEKASPSKEGERHPHLYRFLNEVASRRQGRTPHLEHRLPRRRFFLQKRVQIAAKGPAPRGLARRQKGGGLFEFCGQVGLPALAANDPDVGLGRGSGQQSSRQAGGGRMVFQRLGEQEQGDAPFRQFAQEVFRGTGLHLQLHFGKLALKSFG